ncbi:hypothetical protein NN3_23040 [Nocardia neocaledoniensis NBRC 108232]|uniref:Type VII secretion protein EccE n=1 Tax=Nocardia neocaledoniensis TaxID=236511 RepID=A0A317N211_9NOCA|nr:type VII secretion protein EccE [Nocardia neocaledoniensis]PWV66966.1 type VII secretion protein EccE [Nocardia neocaledoniensis]GEM31297.1 hypothetical protein NN3_23040 [Nocardia neocaledoniensis NBRC 108232]
MIHPRIRIATTERVPFALLVIVGSVVVVALLGRMPLWGIVAAAVVATVAVTVQVGRRTGVRWLIDRIAYRCGRTHRARELAAAASIEDVEVAAGVCGVREDGTVLVSMVQLSPNLDLPTVVSSGGLYTEDAVSLSTLRPLLDHFGIGVDVDIVATGRRVRPAGTYSMLYDQLIGSTPAVGERLTWLVIRLDTARNLAALKRRGPVAEAGPRALASAAHRIARRLREAGITAHPLPATALREAIRHLHAGVELDDLQETWHTIESSVAGRTMTSFLIDWDRFTDGDLDECWSMSPGRTTLVVSLSGASDRTHALVRFVGPAIGKAQPDFLRALTGRQFEALLASLPTATSVAKLADGEPANGGVARGAPVDLTVAIGPTGQILGAINGQPQHSLAMVLFDPAHFNTRHRSIDVRAALPIAQQIVLRAMVVGADVEVHTSRPDSWRRLIDAVADARSIRLVDDGQIGTTSGSEVRCAPTIAVFDQMAPTTVDAPTTVTIEEPGGARRRTADITIDQVSATAVDVAIPMRTVRVDLIEPRGETRYLESSNGQAH